MFFTVNVERWFILKVEHFYATLVSGNHSANENARTEALVGRAQVEIRLVKSGAAVSTLESSDRELGPVQNHDGLDPWGGGGERGLGRF